MHDETSPLLENETAHQDVDSSGPTSREELQQTSRRGIVAVALVLLFVSISNFLSFAADPVILESIICRKYYDGLDERAAQPEESCKVPQVQGEVAFINAWRGVSETLPALALAVPFGILADTLGRKRVLLVAMTGLLLNDMWVRVVYWFGDDLPVRLVWLGGLWQTIGAGAVTLQSLAFVMVAEQCAPDQRTAAFSLIQSSQLLAQFLFISLGGLLLTVDPWLPIVISTVISTATLPLAYFLLSETGQRPKAEQIETTGQADLDDTPETSVCAVQGTSQGRGSLRHGIKSGLDSCRQWLDDNGRTIAILTCFLTFNLGASSRDGTLFLQYASTRLDWSLGKASIFVSIGAGTNLVIHALVIPALSTFLLERRRLTEMVKDKYLAQWSGVALVVGSLVISQASSGASLALGQVVLSCGLAFTPATRSLVTSMVPAEHLATLYTFIAVADYAGALSGGPLSAALFDTGLRWGGPWLGLPFVMSAISFALALVGVTAAARQAV